MTNNDAAVQARLREAMALHQQGRLAEAETAYEAVLYAEPRNFHALHYRGLLLLHANRFERGVDLLRLAVEVNPGVAPTHLQLGYGLEQLKRPAEAVVAYDRAIALKPDMPDAHYNRGNALMDLDRHDEALASYDQAIALHRNYVEAYNNRGLASAKMRRFVDAVVSYDAAIALNAGFADAHYNRSNALTALNQFDEALAGIDRSLALEPGYAEAHNNRGNILLRLDRHAEAIAAYDRALTLNPDLNEVPGARLLAKLRSCDWRNLDAEAADLIASVRRGHVATPPFAFLALPSSPQDQLRCAQDWVAYKFPAPEPPLWQGERYNHARIRVAYLSADFRIHPIGNLVAELFETHDRSRFEIIGVSFGVDDQSDIRKRIAASFDEFHDVAAESDKEIAALLREREVDIAIDLMGYTQDMRPGIFAHRPAPVQVNYLGYPGTMGSPFVDYVIADRIVAPAEHRPFYTEKFVPLPDCYQANDSKRDIAVTPTRLDSNLPESGFVFCCFNSNYKITPVVFDIWMRLLAAVEGSVLWLLEDNATAAANLRNEARARGVKPERLIFASRMALPDHLGRHRLADLFLDTLPYNAHTTASDALWAGLPVLTCIGETFAGKVATSLLKAIGLPELATTMLDDYERLALELATHQDRLAAIRQKLAANRLTTPAFDTPRFTRHIEAAYAAMQARHQAGLPPDHILVAQNGE